MATKSLPQQCRDLTGLRFGRYAVSGPAGRAAYGALRWNCQCDCGARREVDGQSLVSGRAQSCGCLKRERMTSHGQSGGANSSPSPEYNIWTSMIARCSNPKSQSWLRYGGRGISVCERWRVSFDAFLKDMGERPSRLHSLDRINNDGNYSPDNCRWATKKEQARNRSRVHMLHFNGQSLSVAEWAEHIGIPYATLRQRLKKWTLEKSLTTPLTETHSQKRGKSA